MSYIKYLLLSIFLANIRLAFALPEVTSSTLPELMPQYVLPDHPERLEFDPSGKLLLTHNSKETQLWDMRGRLLRNIRTGVSSNMQFSYDGKHLISISNTGVTVLDVAGEMAPLRISPPGVSSEGYVGGRLSPDRKTLAALGPKGIVRIWDARTFQLLKNIELPVVTGSKKIQIGMTRVRGLSFSSDLKTFVTLNGTIDAVLKIFDSNGHLRNEIKTYGVLGAIGSYSMNHQGTLLAYTQGWIKIFHIDKQRFQLIKCPHVDQLFFLDSGREIVATHSDGAVRIWNLDHPDTPRFEYKPGVPHSGCVAAASGSGLIALSCPGEKTRILNTEHPEIYTEIPRSEADFPLKAYFAGPDRMAVLNSKGVKIFNLTGELSGEVVCSPASKKYFMSVSPNSTLYSITHGPTGSWAGNGGFWPVCKMALVDGEGKTLRDFDTRCETPTAFSADSTKVAFVDKSDGIDIYNLKYGTLLSPIRETVKNQVNELFFAPDGKTLISQRQNFSINVWDIRTGKLLRELLVPYYSRNLNSLALSHEGKLGIPSRTVPNSSAVAHDQELSVLDLYSNDVKRVIVPNRGENIPASKKISIMRFSQDGKMILAASEAGDITLINTGGGEAVNYDLSQAEKEKNSVFLGYALTSLQLRDDAKYFLTTVQGNSALTLWNVRTKERVNFVSAGNEWLIYTPDGYFDASSHGGELVAMVKGLDAYSIAQFAARYNRPDLILERMELGHPEQISYYNQLYYKRLKKLGLTEALLNSEVHVPEARITGIKNSGKYVDVEFTISDSEYPLKRFNFYVNDVPLFGLEGKELTGSAFSGTERIELTPGKNKIELMVMNAVGAESYRVPAYADYSGKEKGDLYYLAFGASKYKDPSLDLNYADKDVLDLEAVVSGMRPAYSDVHVKTFLNDEMTAKNIGKARVFLEKATANDTVLLFIAGHGGYDRGKDPKYYFLPYEADKNDLVRTGVDFDTIENLLNDIKPRKKLFFMDTCESGELDDDTYAQYYTLANARGLRPRTSRKPLKARGAIAGNSRPYLYDKNRFIYNNLSLRSGIVVFSSSRGGELSYESSSIRNGFFTKELITALTSRVADSDGDGKIDSAELRAYVSKAVSKDTVGLQNPTIDRDNQYQKIQLPLVELK